MKQVNIYWIKLAPSELISTYFVTIETHPHPPTKHHHIHPSTSGWLHLYCSITMPDKQNLCLFLPKIFQSENIDCCPKFVTGPNMRHRHSSKSIRVPSCPFAKVIPPLVNHFGKRTAWSLKYFLIYVYLNILSQSQILGNGLYVVHCKYNGHRNHN